MIRSTPLGSHAATWTLTRSPRIARFRCATILLALRTPCCRRSLNSDWDGGPISALHGPIGLLRWRRDRIACGKRVFKSVVQPVIESLFPNRILARKAPCIRSPGSWISHLMNPREAKSYKTRKRLPPRSGAMDSPLPLTIRRSAWLFTRDPARRVTITHERRPASGAQDERRTNDR
jgi:hypothetical protein